MYSRKAWGGSVDPFILTKFSPQSDIGDSDPLVSLVIFEWTDESLIGRVESGDTQVCGSRCVAFPVVDFQVLTLLF